MFKKIALGTALATLIAAPAFAGPIYGAQVHAFQQAEAMQAWSPATRSYASVPAVLTRADRVYVNGKYVGQDPDPNVRLQLRQGNPDNLN